MKDNLYRLASEVFLEMEAKEERRKLRPWVGLVLSGACLAALFVLASNAYAESYSLRAQNGDSVTLLDTPCNQGPWFKDWRAARFVYQGKTYESCWRALPDGQTVVVLDSGGDVSAIPLQAFKRDESI